MSNANRDTIPHGYKMTEVGIIPEDWEVKNLGELCHAIVDGTHYTPTYVDNVTADNFRDTKFIV